MTRLSAQERRKQIIQIGLHLFAEHKYQGTTMSLIAKAAGVTEPLIYKHFKSKKDLFLTILSSSYERVIEGLHELFKSKGDIV